MSRGPDHALAVLAVDDEPPALAELEWMLSADPRIGTVETAQDAAAALRRLQERNFDAVFLDIRMPGLSGLELARTLRYFADPPPVVIVSAYEDAAVDAFAIRVVDYLLKPLDERRLGEAVGRVVESRSSAGESDDETIAVELGGVTRFIHRSEVHWVEAQGDYARLRTADASHLVRTPLAALEERWVAHGFVRIHRSYLVSVAHVRDLRSDAAGKHSVTVDDVVLPVSRRSARGLKERLVQSGPQA